MHVLFLLNQNHDVYKTFIFHRYKCALNIIRHVICRYETILFSIDFKSSTFALEDKKYIKPTNKTNTIMMTNNIFNMILLVFFFLVVYLLVDNTYYNEVFAFHYVDHYKNPHTFRFFSCVCSFFLNSPS